MEIPLAKQNNRGRHMATLRKNRLSGKVYASRASESGMFTQSRFLKYLENFNYENNHSNKINIHFLVLRSKVHTFCAKVHRRLDNFRGDHKPWYRMYDERLLYN
jgi:hypothetical protein